MSKEMLSANYLAIKVVSEEHRLKVIKYFEKLGFLNTSKSNFDSQPYYMSCKKSNNINNVSESFVLRNKIKIIELPLEI